MFAFVTRLLLGTSSKSVPSPQTTRLGLDAFEERVVPATVSFAGGVLNVQADATTDDYVRITSAGAHRDGSTGVKVLTNVTGSWTLTTYGSAANPVTNVALDMKDGNDFVDVAALRATTVFVGEGNGNNFVFLGDTKSGGLVAGSGSNFVSIGGGSANVFGSSSLPGVSAGTAVFMGWSYQFANGGKDIFAGGAVGNANTNVIHMNTARGETSIVDLSGNGNNLIVGGSGTDAVFVHGDGNNRLFTGGGDDRVVVIGAGNNDVHAGAGANTVNISGNGNNRVRAHGTGSITVSGSGKNAVHAGPDSSNTVSLNGAGAGSSITASHLAGVFVDGVQVTASGVVGNVKVKLV